MANQDIVNRWTKALIYRSETATTRSVVVKEALTKGVSLSGSNLSGSDLRGSNLSGSDLSGSNLRGSNLSGSDLRGSNLRGSDLSGSDLRGSNLRGSNLSGSNLRGSNLRGSNLSGSNLSGSNLRGSDLSGSDLSGSNLSEIRADFFTVLAAAPAEVCGLLVALRLGKIDGSTYVGACSCLVGTLAAVRGCGYDAIPGLQPNGSRPAERWFLAIRPGQMPLHSPIAAIAEGWIVEWLKENRLETLAFVEADGALEAAIATVANERQRLAAANDAAGLNALALRVGANLEESPRVTK